MRVRKLGYLIFPVIDLTRLVIQSLVQGGCAKWQHGVLPSIELDIEQGCNALYRSVTLSRVDHCTGSRVCFSSPLDASRPGGQVRAGHVEPPLLRTIFLWYLFSEKYMTFLGEAPFRHWALYWLRTRSRGATRVFGFQRNISSHGNHGKGQRVGPGRHIRRSRSHFRRT